MKYLIGLIIGLIVGIVLFIGWKKIFGKFLPMEDSVLLKVISAIGYSIACMACGALVASFNIYAVFAALVLIIITFLVTYGFGIYYKVTSTKNINV